MMISFSQLLGHSIPPLQPYVTADRGWKKIFRISTTNCLIFRLIRLSFLPKSVKSITLSQSRFFRLGDVLRDRPATPEVGTCVPNGCRHGGAPRRHGGAAAICKTR